MTENWNETKAIMGKVVALLEDPHELAEIMDHIRTIEDSVNNLHAELLEMYEEADKSSFDLVNDEVCMYFFECVNRLHLFQDDILKYGLALRYCGKDDIVPFITPVYRNISDVLVILLEGINEKNSELAN